MSLPKSLKQEIREAKEVMLLERNKPKKEREGLETGRKLLKVESKKNER